MKRMQVSTLLSLFVAVALLAAPMASLAEYDKQAVKKTAESKKSTKAAAKDAPKMFWPYSKIKLEREQKEKIKDIRTETNRKIRELKEAERQQIMQLLSKDQQTTVEKLEAAKHEEHMKKLKAWSEKKKQEAKKQNDSVKKAIDKKKQTHEEKLKKDYEKKTGKVKDQAKDL